MEFVDVKDYTLALGAAEATTGSLKGTTKRGDGKSSQGEEADCMSEGEWRRNLRRRPVFPVVVMYGLGAYGSLVNLQTL